MKWSLLSLALIGQSIFGASGLDGGIRIQDGTDANTNHTSRVTISALTNVNVGSIVISNLNAGAIVKVDSNNKSAPAIAGTDYQSPITSASIPNSALVNSTVTITGTANQVNVSGSPASLGGTVILSAPQDISTTSSPTFRAATITTNIGIGTAPTSGTTMTLKGTTSDATSFQLYGYNSSSQLTTRIDSAGRLDLFGPGPGGVLALYNLAPPISGLKAGHYAFGLYDSHTHLHTIGTFNAFSTDITATNISSKLQWQYMDGVNGEPGGTYDYQQPNKTMELSSSGFDVPTALRLGTNYASTGMIRLPNNSLVTARNAGDTGDVVATSVASDNGVYIGSGATLVAFQPGGATRFYFGSTALNVGANNTYDVGSASAAPRTIYAATSVLAAAVTATNSVSIGASPASAGAVRMANNTAINARNAADSADIPVINTGSDNSVNVGGANASLVGFYTAGTLRGYWGSTALNFGANNTYGVGADAVRARAVYTGFEAGAATSPAQITSNQNDYNPGGQGEFLRLSTDASRNLTGLTFTTAQVSGEKHYAINVGAQGIVIVHESSSSTAANRFHNTTGADITLSADQQAFMHYDLTTARWRVSKMN